MLLSFNTQIYHKYSIFQLVTFTDITSQVTYVTMVPRVGNETLRPLGVATGNAFIMTRV